MFGKLSVNKFFKNDIAIDKKKVFFAVSKHSSDSDNFYVYLIWIIVFQSGI